MQYLPVMLIVMFIVVVLKLLFAKHVYSLIASEKIPKPSTVLNTDTLLDWLVEKSIPFASTAISLSLTTVPATVNDTIQVGQHGKLYSFTATWYLGLALDFHQLAAIVLHR